MCFISILFQQPALWFRSTVQEENTDATFKLGGVFDALAAADQNDDRVWIKATS
jgi:hypothetical protein